MGGALAALTTTDVPVGSLLAVPVGACEQHGPHLPLGTDTTVAVALARGLADHRHDLLVAPALPYGASGEHAGFAGTLSIGTEALTQVLVEVVRSADAFAGVVLVSGHGGNAAALRAATDLLSEEGRRVLSWSPRSSLAGGATDRSPDSHAGWVETSVLLAIDPAAVDMASAAAGDTRPLAELIGALRAGGVAAVSPTGVLGDPTGATAELGRAVLDAWTADLVDAVERWFL